MDKLFQWCSNKQSPAQNFCMEIKSNLNFYYINGGTIVSINEQKFLPACIIKQDFNLVR